jgi:hypothetical protein
MKTPVLAVLATAAALVVSQPVQARVTKITILTDTSPAFCTGTPPTCTSFGTAGEYEVITGLAEGVLDPSDPLNAIIQDIDLGKDPDGKVRYTSTFQIVKPVDMSKASGLMWHDVPNRGGRITIVDIEKGFGDVGLSSGWQGDNSGSPTGAGTLQSKTTNEWVQVPVAHHRNGSSVTGAVMARIVNRSGPGSNLLFVQVNQFPYRPDTLDTTKATLKVHEHETMTGKVTVLRTIPSTDWAWATCTDWAHQTPDPTAVCLKDGYDPNLLYQVQFTAKDPYVLGVGFAAFRDLESFFKYETKDDFGTPNPVARKIRWSIIRGVSQSGNALRAYLHLGFNEDEHRRQVDDGAWPIIAGRRVALDFRWAQPDGVLELYEVGSEGPQWWADYEDHVRELPRRGILDRCRRTRTCPKVIEHFGSAEVWELKLPLEWVGTDAKRDIPIPENVRRYYIPSTTHGGGAGGFNQNPSTAAVNCPGNNWGQGVLPANPVPHTETLNAIRVHLRNWIMNGTKPPPSLYPTIGPAPVIAREDDHGDEEYRRDGDEDERDDGRGDRHHQKGFLVTPTKKAMGFPDGIPGLPATVPESSTITSLDGVVLAKPIVETPFINPVLDYNWGPDFNPSDATGVPTNFPPPIRQVINLLVPRVDADGNELGGVPVVLRDAPLGSYFGWNITAAGFHKDQNCDYIGGMVPFAVTKTDRVATGDPRLSLEERYHDHAGYIAAVTAAADNAVAKGFLLPADHDNLIAEATASNVLVPAP